MDTSVQVEYVFRAVIEFDAPELARKMNVPVVSVVAHSVGLVVCVQMGLYLGERIVEPSFPQTGDWAS